MLVLFVGILVFEEHPVGYLRGELGRAAAHRRRRRHPGRLLRAGGPRGRRRSRAGAPSRSAATCCCWSPPRCWPPSCRRPSPAPRSSTWCRCRPCRSASPASSSPTPATTSRTRWASSRVAYLVVVARRGRRPAAALPAGERRVTGRRARLRRGLALVRRHRRPGRRLLRARPRRHRPAGPQRRRQVDRAEAVRGLHPAQHRARCACSAPTSRATRPPTAASASRTTATPSGPSSPRARWWRCARGCAASRDPEAAASRALDEVALADAADRERAGLLARHAPAREAGPGPRPRPRAAAARRAAQRPRPRPAAPRRRADRAPRRGGPHGAGLLARAARGRAHGAAGAGAGQRPPGGQRRHPRPSAT